MSAPRHLQNSWPMLNERDCSVTIMTLLPGFNLIHGYCQHSLLFRFCLSHGSNQTECKEKYRWYSIPQTFRWQGYGPCKVSVCSASSEATEVWYPWNKDLTKSDSVLTLWGWVSAASHTSMYLSLTSDMNLWFQNQVWCILCQNGAKHVVCDSCYNVTCFHHLSCGSPPISDLNNLYFLCTQCHKMKKQTLKHKEPYQVNFLERGMPDAVLTLCRASTTTQKWLHHTTRTPSLSMPLSLGGVGMWWLITSWSYILFSQLWQRPPVRWRL